MAKVGEKLWAGILFALFLFALLLTAPYRGAKALFRRPGRPGRERRQRRW